MFEKKSFEVVVSGGVHLHLVLWLMQDTINIKFKLYWYHGTTKNPNRNVMGVFLILFYSVCATKNQIGQKLLQNTDIPYGGKNERENV